MSLRLQKYLLPLGNSISESIHYATAYLEVKIDNPQYNRKFSEIVLNTNRSILTNIRKLRNGDFDHITTKFKLDPSSTLSLNSLPYEILNQINLNDSNNPQHDVSDQIYNAYFKDRPISPATLELDTWWPENFKYVGYKVQTLDLHISLLPLIRFDTQNELSTFIERFNSFPSSSTPIPTTVTFSNNLKILPKYDYSKFFLTMCIDRTDPANAPLHHFQTQLYRHVRVPPFQGSVAGEINGHIIDWEKSLLHMSLGVCNSPRSWPTFSPLELSLLNTFLPPIAEPPTPTLTLPLGSAVAVADAARLGRRP